MAEEFFRQLALLEDSKGRLYLINRQNYPLTDSRQMYLKREVSTLTTDEAFSIIGTWIRLNQQCPNQCKLYGHYLLYTENPDYSLILKEILPVISHPKARL